MRLVTFRHEHKTSVGIAFYDRHFLSLKRAAEELDNNRWRQFLPVFSDDMVSLLAAGEEMIEAADELLNSAKDMFAKDKERLLQKHVLVESSDITLLAPVLNPSKIIAIGLNYMDHCREQKIDPPETPVIFTKFTNAILNPQDPITWDPELTRQVDYEAELGVVIGKRAKRVAAADAYDYIAGYTMINDVSARDLQFGDGQWVRGKSLDTFCPMGPAITTRDEIPDPHDLTIQCTVNGRLLQNSTTAEMIFKIPELIEFVTQGITLEPGDIISTGTPDGVGVFRDPKVFLKDGDEVSVLIENLGILSNPCCESATGNRES